jgi:hypothetical protein
LNVLGATGVAPGAHNLLNKSPKAKAISPWKRQQAMTDKKADMMGDLKRETVRESSGMITHIHPQRVLVVYFSTIISKKIVYKLWCVC